MRRSRYHLESKSLRVYMMSRKPDLKLQIYNELYNILYLYKNDEIYLTAEIASQAIYEIIKNYIKENNNE